MEQCRQPGRLRQLEQAMPMIPADAVAYSTPYRVESPARARGCLTCSGFQGRF
jgi:hypothetical protein